MKYRGHKNWVNTGWIDDFIAGAKAAGLKCVVVGSKDIGIKGADYRHFNVPLKDLFGILGRAEFVLGLQGFITIIALLQQRRVLLKRENFRVSSITFIRAGIGTGKFSPSRATGRRRKRRRC